MGEHLPCKQKDEGSSPFWYTNLWVTIPIGRGSRLKSYTVSVQIRGNLPFMNYYTISGISSAGRASALQAESQWFEPTILYHYAGIV